MTNWKKALLLQDLNINFYAGTTESMDSAGSQWECMRPVSIQTTSWLSKVAKSAEWKQVRSVGFISELSDGAQMRIPTSHQAGNVVAYLLKTKWIKSPPPLKISSGDDMMLLSVLLIPQNVLKEPRSTHVPLVQSNRRQKFAKKSKSEECDRRHASLKWVHLAGIISLELWAEHFPVQQRFQITMQ